MVFNRVLQVIGLILFSHVSMVLGQNNTTILPDQNYTDPFLKYQPHFARSLPVQLLATGIVLALCSILIIHLGFTWQYHWPLSRVNWILQFSGACTLLLNILAILFVVLNALTEKSREWPYMFEYIAIDVPRLEEWSVAEVAAWYVMEAATSALVSITHIQFLTFLYPSRLEGRLVFLLLGPLAVLSSIMTLLPIATYNYNPDEDNRETMAALNATRAMVLNTTITNNTNTFPIPFTHSEHQQLYDIIDAAKHICNLTLSFLFTLSLLIWGFFVNRTSAWRTDGGTAIFGAGALFLALVSTGLNFLKVVITSSLEWLSPLLWVVILWQSFFGWWWWVGSASGIAERELQQLERRGRKERKRKGKKKRQGTGGSSQEEDVFHTGPMAALERWRTSVGATISRRRHNGDTPHRQERDSPHEAEIATISSVPGDSARDTASISTTGSNTFFGSIRRAWRSLRQAHIRATRVQALEHRNIQLQMQLENGHGLGRFPGGPGGDIDLHVFRTHGDNGSDGDISPPRPVRDIPRIRNTEVSRFPGLSLSQTLRKWRLRDSTTY